jgi:hypothetical protein
MQLLVNNNLSIYDRTDTKIANAAHYHTANWDYFRMIFFNFLF